MIVRVLGFCGGSVPGCSLPSFMVNDSILLDAGSFADILSMSEQQKIRHIFLTHSHLDHIKDVFFFADNLFVSGFSETVNVYAEKGVLDVIKSNIMNFDIWPDFSEIPSTEKPILNMVPINTGKTYLVDKIGITPFRVNHGTLSVGYLVEDNEKFMFYSGDTGPNENLWDKIKVKLDVLIIEVSFPDEMENMAVLTGHLTPSLLGKEFAKMSLLPKKVYITHIKPSFSKKIEKQLGELGKLFKNDMTIEIMRRGMEIII